MAFLDVVFRALNKAGDSFIEMRREDGHGSEELNPTYVVDNSLVERVGEVNASPTANTVLDRLKQIQESLGSSSDLHALLTSISNEVQSLNNDNATEDKQDDIISKLNDILVEVTSIDDDGAKEAKQDNIITSLGDVLLELQSINTNQATSANQQTIIDEIQSGVTVHQGSAGVEAWKVTLNNEVLTASIDNLPTEYPLPASQVIDLKNVVASQAGNWSVSIDNFPSTQTVDGTVSVNNLLPDNHQVTVSNQIDQPLTDTQLRATPVPVSGTVTSTPSGTQDVNVVSSTELEVTLNGEPVELWRGDSQADALFVQWNGSQQVTVQGSVQVVNQGNNSLSVDATQDGAWSVSVDNFPTSFDVGNFPTEYPLPTAQVTALTPQTDALTDAQLRATPVNVDTGLTQPTTPTDTQPISATSLPLPTGAATAANQLPDNHNVTVSNQIAQPVQDGGSVNVGNLPVNYPLPAAQVTTLTPQTDALTDAELRASPVAVENLAQLVPEQYDEIVLSYTGDDLTGVVYKAATLTVATLTLGYTSGKLTSVVRS